MVSARRRDFLTVRAWHDAVLGGKDVILRRTSALEYLELFNGYLDEKEIYVYAKHPGEFENVNYHIVDSFDNVEWVRIGSMLCATAAQTFNEMLADYGNIDETALIEGLAEYYYAHGKSFGGLAIQAENMARFNEVKDWAVAFYCWG